MRKAVFTGTAEELNKYANDPKIKINMQMMQMLNKNQNTWNVDKSFLSLATGRQPGRISEITAIDLKWPENLFPGRFRHAIVESEVKNLEILHPEAKIYKPNLLEIKNSTLAWFWDSGHAQVAIYTAFHEESESEAKKC